MTDFEYTDEINRLAVVVALEASTYPHMLTCPEIARALCGLTMPEDTLYLHVATLLHLRVIAGNELPDCRPVLHLAGGTYYTVTRRGIRWAVGEIERLGADRLRDRLEPRGVPFEDAARRLDSVVRAWWILASLDTTADVPRAAPRRWPGH